MHKMRRGGAVKPLLCMVLTAAVMLLCLLTEALLMSMEKLPSGFEKIYITISLVLSAAVGTNILAQGMTQRKMTAALLITVIYMMLLIMTGMAAGGVNYNIGDAPFQLLCVALGAITGSILAASGRKKRHGEYRK